MPRVYPPIMPRLTSQRRDHAEAEKKSFARNLADSVTVNVAASPTRKLDKVQITNTGELAQAFYNMSRVSNKRR